MTYRCVHCLTELPVPEGELVPEPCPAHPDGAVELIPDDE